MIKTLRIHTQLVGWIAGYIAFATSQLKETSEVSQPVGLPGDVPRHGVPCDREVGWHRRDTSRSTVEIKQAPTRHSLR
jgi:hypothetical protein